MKPYRTIYSSIDEDGVITIATTINSYEYEDDPIEMQTETTITINFSYSDIEQTINISDALDRDDLLQHLIQVDNVKQEIARKNKIKEED